MMPEIEISLKNSDEKILSYVQPIKDGESASVIYNVAVALIRDLTRVHLDMLSKVGTNGS
jgi:hypothetical protein